MPSCCFQVLRYRRRRLLIQSPWPWSDWWRWAQTLASRANRSGGNSRAMAIRSEAESTASGAVRRAASASRSALANGTSPESTDERSEGISSRTSAAPRLRRA